MHLSAHFQHLMNEWLSEKGDKPGKTDPLEVSVDEDDSMFVTCLPSPRNSMDRLRRNSQSNGGRPLTQSQSSAGSAKKVNYAEYLLIVIKIAIKITIISDLLVTSWGILMELLQKTRI